MAAFLAGLAGREAVETHISAVFVGQDTVYKLKKAVRLGFLDFTGVEDRRRFLERELELNAPFAPGLYRDVVQVGRGPAGLGLGGGEAVDWVLRMAPVPPADFLDEVARAGGMDPALLTAVADAVAAMHAAQVPVGDADPVGRMRRVVEGNAGAARDAGIATGAVDAWRQGVLAALEEAAPALRARAGLVRRAHGDLHLGNLLLWEGRPVPFDALEFDEGLATIDPGYDLAFLLMDLDLNVGRAASNLVLCRYVARTGDAGLVAGLRPFLTMRALVRAHVEAKRGRPHERLLGAAMDHLRPGRAAVLAVGGLMGSGKSTLARAVAPGFGAAPGALVLRSDEVRKRLYRVAPEDRLPAEAYTAEGHARTAAALIESARAALGGGQAVIVDATFLDPAFAAAVAGLAAPFLGVWLEAPLPELERRVLARRGDASDADVAVLRAAAAGAVVPPGWMRVDSGEAGAGDGWAARRQVQAGLDLL